MHVESNSGPLLGEAMLTYYDPNLLPQLTSVEPNIAPCDAPKTLRVRGSNFAPVSASMRCGFGVAGQTQATFVCESGPGSSATRLS